MLLSKESCLDGKFCLSMENKKPKGQWLQDLLDGAGITASTLSQLTGVDTAVISNIINGKKGIGMGIAQKFGKALDLDPGDILRDAGVWERVDAADTLDKQISKLVKKFPLEEKKKIAQRLKLEAKLYEQQRPSRP
jgi:transcriptional regulator with XRE-family HTH domain